MYPWVATLVLMLLLTDSVMSYQQVTATEGQTVILPCTYRGEITTSCWGQGACTLLSCSNSIIMANGYRVTYQKSSHYSLRGHIERGDVSLTITKVKLSDSGVYCCRVEKRGWFNDIKITFTLNVKPAPTTTKVVTTTPRRTTTTTPRTTTTTPRRTTTTTPRRTTTTTPRTTTTTPRRTTTTTPRTTTTTPRRTTTTTPKTTVTTTPKTTITTTPETTITTTPKTTVTTTPKTTVTTTPTTTVTTTPETIIITTPKKMVTIAPATRSSTSVPPKPATTKIVHPGAGLTSPPKQVHTQPTRPQNTSMSSSLVPSCSTDGNTTVTQFSDGPQQNNQTSMMLGQNHWLSNKEGLYIGIGVTAIALLFTCLTVIIAKRYFCLGSKVQLLRIISFRDTPFGALKNMSVKHVRAEDNIYIIEDSH